MLELVGISRFFKQEFFFICEELKQSTLKKLFRVRINRDYSVLLTGISVLVCGELKRNVLKNNYFAFNLIGITQL